MNLMVGCIIVHGALVGLGMENGMTLILRTTFMDMSVKLQPFVVDII